MIRTHHPPSRTRAGRAQDSARDGRGRGVPPRAVVLEAGSPYRARTASPTRRAHHTRHVLTPTRRPAPRRLAPA
ncbi:hypothetical protein NKH77_26060 [Streptomyces sp. M19]